MGGQSMIAWSDAKFGYCYDLQGGLCRVEHLSWASDFCRNNHTGNSCDDCKISTQQRKFRLSFFIPKFIWMNAHLLFSKYIVCRFWDHDWNDTSYAGPDSGAMGMECNRCGAGGTTVMY